MPPDRYKYFRIEARELLERMGRAILALERVPESPETVGQLLRDAHTLKGAARVVGHAAVAAAAHDIEDVLEPLRQGGSMTDTAVMALLQDLDAIAVAVTALEEAPRPALEAPPLAEPTEAVRIDLQELDVLLDGVAELSVRLGALHQAVGQARDLQRTARTVAEALRLSPRERDLDRARLQAEDVAAQADQLKERMASGLDGMERELGDVRERAVRLRLLPASSIFGALERAARDAAQALGRQVEVRPEGGDERVDGHVLSAVRDALLHAVRNAVAHGIESPEERRAAGKPLLGVIRIGVTRHDYSVRFTCRDDGRGIDVPAVARAALRKGLVTSDEAGGMAMDQAIRLVIAGRVTTAAQLSGVAGRGIGLDVVRETVARLKGDLHVQSQPGRGTDVELRVPLTLSALPVLVVASAGMTVSLPLESVVATVRLHPRDVVLSADSASVVHDGLALPFVPLAQVLGLPGSPGRGAGTAVVVRAREARAVVAVDRLIGPERVVTRRLPALAGPVPLVSGASLEADGSPRWVLDAGALVEAARAAGLPREVGARERPPVLVVDDSLTTRMLEQSILETAGYEVTLAESAEEGLETARRRRFGVMLVDIEMPGMDGFEFLERCQKDPTLRDVPTILVSSRSSAEDRRRGLELGAFAYVDKNEFDQGRLLDMIRGLMG